MTEESVYVDFSELGQFLKLHGTQLGCAGAPGAGQHDQGGRCARRSWSGSGGWGGSYRPRHGSSCARTYVLCTLTCIKCTTLCFWIFHSVHIFKACCLIFKIKLLSFENRKPYKLSLHLCLNIAK